MTREHYLLKGLKNLIRKMNYLELCDDLEAELITDDEFSKELKDNEDKYLISSNRIDESDFTVVFELSKELGPILREDFTTSDIADMFGIDHLQMDEMVEKFTQEKP